jgi:two-component system, sensor histidine kinase
MGKNVKEPMLTKTQQLPLWTWIAPFFILGAGSMLSQLSSFNDGTILFYLPIPMIIVLVHWWGLRVLPAVYCHSLAMAIYSEWQLEYWPLLALHEVAVGFVSWFLVNQVIDSKYWLPNIRQTLSFLVFGIFFPVTVNALFAVFYAGPQVQWPHVIMIWTADLACSVAVAFPALYFFTPALARRKLVTNINDELKTKRFFFRSARQRKLEVTLSFLFVLGLTATLPIEKYWFIYGIFTTYVSLRFGFGSTLIVNSLIFLLTYLPPFLIDSNLAPLVSSASLINIHLGMCMLSITACVTGRVITDLRKTEQVLYAKNFQLERTNKELDSFVYSASHDLSAPLKSLLGLIQVSRIEKDSSRHIEYINKMELSILKLEGFIKEILDFSRNGRLEVQIQPVRIQALIEEILDNLKFIDDFSNLTIDYKALEVDVVKTDKLRFKIILNNLISNAIKYQRRTTDASPYIWISSEMNHHYFLLRVRDNGQGIHKDTRSKIFDMFYRGTEQSSGSGLGLYIAKEAAETLGGKIDFESEYGEGSTFTVYLPKSDQLIMVAGNVRKKESGKKAWRLTVLKDASA